MAIVRVSTFGRIRSCVSRAALWTFVICTTLTIVLSIAPFCLVHYERLVAGCSSCRLGFPSKHRLVLALEDEYTQVLESTKSEPTKQQASLSTSLPSPGQIVRLQFPELPPMDQTDADLLWKANGGHDPTPPPERTITHPAAMIYKNRTFIAAEEHAYLLENNQLSRIILLVTTTTVDQRSNSNSSQALPSIAFPNKPVIRLRPSVELPIAVQRCFLRQQKVQLNSGPSNPRIFSFNHSIWVSFHFYPTTHPLRWNIPCSELTEYVPSLWIFDPLHGTEAVEIRAAFGSTTPTVDWALFSLYPILSATGELLLAITAVEPHVIFQVDPSSGSASSLARSSSASLFKKFPEEAKLSTFTTPARIVLDDITRTTILGNSSHLDILHDHDGVMLGMFHESSSPAPKHYLYVFAETYPFEVLCVASGSIEFEHSELLRGTNLEVLGRNHLVAIWFNDKDGGGVSYFDLLATMREMNCLRAGESYRSRSSYFISNSGYDYGSNASSVNEKETKAMAIKPFNARVVRLQFETGFRRSCGVFNPSILALPCGSKYPYVVVARLPHWQSTRQDPSGNEKDIFNSKMVACVMDSDFYCVEGRQELDLPIPTEKVDQRLFNPPENDKDYDYDEYYGAEDGRLIWEPDSWKVLLVYGMNTDVQEGLERSIWIINLAQVFPDLERVLPDPPTSRAALTSSRTRKRFSVPTEMVYHESRGKIEKNWTPFVYHGRVLISYGLYPKIVLNITNKGLATKLFDTRQSTQFDSIDHSRYRVHQGSGAIRVRLCEFPKCVVGAPEVYVTIFHRKTNFESEYAHYVAVFHGEPPFDVIRVFEMDEWEASIVGKIDVFRFVFVMSLDFVRPRCEGIQEGRHGELRRRADIDETKATNTGEMDREFNSTTIDDIAFLDSTAIIGFGTDDTGAYSYELPVGKLLSKYLELMSKR